MRAFVIAFVLATLTSAALTPLVRRVALRIGAVSSAGGRNVNVRTVPRLGGVAIALGFFVPLVTIFPAESTVALDLRLAWRKLAGLLLGALLLATVGALDDTRRLRALHKLAFQVLGASIAYLSGYSIEAVRLPLLGTLSMGVFALPITVVWIVGIVNAVNLIDGLDGLAGGVVFFAGVTNFVVSYVAGDTLVCALMATMLGAVLGFLFFNFNPARIFMGDSGSYFLGFVLGSVSLSNGTSRTASTAVSILVPILALGLPIFDTLLAMVRRYLARRPIFSPDRGHVHHRLLDMGLTHRRAVLLLYGVCCVFTVAAIAVSLGHNWQVGVAILAASVVVIGLVRFLGYFEYLFIMRRQRAQLRADDTEVLRRLVPDALAIFDAVNTEDGLWEAVAGLLAPASILDVEVTRVGTGEVLRTLHRDVAVEPEERVSVRFSMGPERLARTSVQIRWRSIQGEVSPQTEVLLQLLVDAMSRALTRFGSSIAPAAEPVRAPLPIVIAASAHAKASSPQLQTET